MTQYRTRAHKGPSTDSCDHFGRLARYETSIERSLYRALQELHRLQGARTEGNLPAPCRVWEKLGLYWVPAGKASPEHQTPMDRIMSDMARGKV